jgi:type II secretory pathway pseudopilin PulG
MTECKPKLRIAPQTGGAAAGSRGFSAIEVTAVAAIIFVLALVLVPIVNKRVDESKRTAAEEDLLAFEKSEQMAYGYTSHYFRLCDLDRPAPDEADKAAQVTTPYGTSTAAALKVPPAYWNQPVTQQTETNYLIQNWRGPFLPKLHKDRSMGLQQVVMARPELFNTTGLPGTAGVTPQGGPIFVFMGDDYDWTAPTGLFPYKLYPLDPWGNPYLFFGSGYYGTLAGQLAIQPSDQRNWPNAAVYSLGPDGIAGGRALYGMGVQPTALDYFRESYKLGNATSDDLVREF